MPGGVSDNQKIGPANYRVQIYRKRFIRKYHLSNMNDIIENYT